MLSLLRSLLLLIAFAPNSAVAPDEESQCQAGDGSTCGPAALVAPPGIFGAWAQDSERILAVQSALEHGRAVLIHNAFDTALAKSMRDELLSAVSMSAYDRSAFVGGGTPREEMVDIPDSAFKATALNKLCDKMRKFNTRGFQFRGHGVGPQLRSDTSRLAKLIGLVRTLSSVQVRRWVGELLNLATRAPSGSEVVDFGSNLFWFKPGDFYGMHNDVANEGGVLRTLSFTYYLGPAANEGGWDSKWGGRFVWCRRAMNTTSTKRASPSFVTPDFNTLFLFRVDKGTDHFVERVFQSEQEALRAPRLSMQGWWSVPTPRGLENGEKWQKQLHRQSSILPPLVVN